MTPTKILVHADGGDCHGTPLVKGRCPKCGMPADTAGPIGSRKVIREMLAEQALSDEQIDEIAVAAFGAGVLAIAAAGHPGAMVHSCDGGLGSVETTTTTAPSARSRARRRSTSVKRAPASIWRSYARATTPLRKRFFANGPNGRYLPFDFGDAN